LCSVARARTLTVLPRLEGDRKARVVQFLYESGLIAKNRPIVAMSGADLSGANLREATGWTEEELRRASSLEGATMPDGQKYEDWLKGRGPD
jgi:uncharacterized protein YjbI with pentapeptide repeats